MAPECKGPKEKRELPFPHIYYSERETSLEGTLGTASGALEFERWVSQADALGEMDVNFQVKMKPHSGLV